MLSKSPSESVSLFFKNRSNNVGNNEKLLVFLMMFFTQFQLAISQSPTATPSRSPASSEGTFWIILGSVLVAPFLIAGCCVWGMSGFKCCARNKEYDEVGDDQQAIDAYQLPELTLKVDPL